MLALLAWLVLAGLIAGIVASLLKMPLANLFVQAAGTLIATGILLGMAFRLGWLGKIGLTSLGRWTAWALTLVLGVYVVVTSLYSYFGEMGFAAGSLVDTPEARAILPQTPLVGFVEETVFRGFLLYALVRVWGGTKCGVVAAMLVQAALFGALHALQVLAGTAPAAALANVLATFVFGVWLGAFVLSVGSLWPAIVRHTVANAFPLIKGLSSPWVDPGFLGYLREAGFELPLALLGLWIVVRVRSARRPAARVWAEPAP